jgi:hypothetical protein
VTTPDQRRCVTERDCPKTYPKALTFPDSNVQGTHTLASSAQDNHHFYKGILLLLHLKQGPLLTRPIIYK